MKLNAHLHLVLRLRMSGVIPLLPLYVSMLCTETSLLFHIYHSHGNQGRDLSSFHSLHVSSGAHPASYPVGTRVLSLEVKWPGREAHHLPSSHAKVQNEWSYMSIPPLPSCHAQGVLCFLFTLHGVTVLKTPAKSTAVVHKDNTSWIKRG